MQVKTPQYSSYIEISKSALKSNINYIKQNLLPAGKVLSCVVKGNAYGHGAKEIVKIHQEYNKIKHFSVYSAYEASIIKKVADHKTTIMIIGHTSDRDLPWVIKNKIDFYLYDTTHLYRVIEVAKKLSMKARIHIEVETGMNRTGFLMKNFKNCIDEIKANLKHIEVRGLATHFAGAESIVNHPRVREQIKKYQKFKQLIDAAGVSVKHYHTACSAASLRFPKTKMDLIRIGILQYGFWPNQETYIVHRQKNKLNENPLKRVISWKSEVMTVKRVRQGEYIGYGTAYIANENKLIAVVPVGYSNGYSRGLSNQARVLVGGEYAQVTGIVNMNAISIDVTHIPNVEIGDEVVLIGKQNEKEISVSSFSEFTDQLNYEVLTRLPIDIPRKIVD